MAHLSASDAAASAQGSILRPRPIRRTKSMRRVEDEQGQDLGELLLRLAYREHLSYAEISERLSVPPGTVGAWMRQFGLTRQDLIRAVGI